VSRVAIDAPFGWPAEFVRAISEYTRDGTWPTSDPARLLLRETDRYVKLTSGQRPLSVSSDRIAYAAMRCARLLAEAVSDGSLDRSGQGRYIEVYPAATIRLWGLDPRRYKGQRPENCLRRASLVRELRLKMPWLQLAPAQLEMLNRSDHALDALISAVIARAVETGHALPVPADAVTAAGEEGWIRLPTPSALPQLAIGSVGL